MQTCVPTLKAAPRGLNEILYWTNNFELAHTQTEIHKHKYDIWTRFAAGQYGRQRIPILIPALILKISCSLLQLKLCWIHIKTQISLLYHSQNADIIQLVD